MGFRSAVRRRLAEWNALHAVILYVTAMLTLSRIDWVANDAGWVQVPIGLATGVMVSEIDLLMRRRRNAQRQ